MARGADLTPHAVQHAIEYNRERFGRPFLRRIQTRMAYHGTGVVNAAFVRAVADWQEAHLGAGRGDGLLGPATEANLHLLLPEAECAVQAARQMLVRGGYLYDGWDNDMRDNDCNGRLDAADPGEASARDGSHYGRTYPRFRVRAGTYWGGWRGARGRVTVTADRELRGEFLYRNCADIISAAYNTAHVMRLHRQTADILGEFKHKGFVWQRSTGYPDEYLPGDFICTYSNAAEHRGGHSAIVVEGGPTHRGSRAPLVIDLPGPSSQVSEGIYNPANTNDLQLHRWPAFRVNSNHEWQFLGRLLRSRLRGHR